MRVQLFPLQNMGDDRRAGAADVLRHTDLCVHLCPLHSPRNCWATSTI